MNWIFRGWGWRARRALSPYGRLFAYGEDPDVIRRPLLMLLDTGTGRSYVLAHREWPLSFSADGTLLAVDISKSGGYFTNKVGFFDMRTGRHLPLQVATQAAGDPQLYPRGHWAPKGASFAFRSWANLYVVDVRAAFPKRQLVLTDPRLGNSESSVQWLDERTLGLVLSSKKTEKRELAIVRLVDGTWRKRVIAVPKASIRVPPGLRTAGVSRTRRRMGSTARSSPRRARERPGVSCFARGTASFADLRLDSDYRLVVEHRKALGMRSPSLISQPNHRVLHSSSDISFKGWSPDGRYLTLSLEDGSFRTLSLLDRSIVRLPIEGNVEIVGWANGAAGPAAAESPPPLPPVEVASGDRLTSRGRISEISSSGKRVAAIVDESKPDCHHVVAWTAGSSKPVRFDRPRACDSEGANRQGDEGLVKIELRGTRLAWVGQTWGNFVYEGGRSADMRRPRLGVRWRGWGDGEDHEAHRAPKPWSGSKRGVRIHVDKGIVVLKRLGDGRVVASARLVASSTPSSRTRASSTPTTRAGRGRARSSSCPSPSCSAEPGDCPSGPTDRRTGGARQAPGSFAPAGCGRRSRRTR
jgi:hypothetical protein